MNTTANPATVLIVDDTPYNISLLNAALMDEYVVKVATSGKLAIEICLSMPIDIILLDVMMPDMDGFETCRRLKQHPKTRAIPVIFITARADNEDETMGFECGGVDYITKPIRSTTVLARVRTHLALFDQNRTLERLVQERTAELQNTRIEILQRLGSAGEFRDNETGLHVVRVCNYSRIIAEAFGLPANETDLVSNAAALHDVGKISVPDSILFKPDKLDEDEWAIMRTHCENGSRIIGVHQNDLLKSAAEIALTHHERWDGNGYPQKLAAEDIPLFGRIVAIADMFDALVSERPYKRAWSVAEAVEEIKRCRNRHFDPQIVDAFLCRTVELEQINRQFADSYSTT